MAQYNHWLEKMYNEITEKKKEPYILTGGMTTSGPAHMGTVCEFLFPHAIHLMLKKNGKETEFIFIGDILDAFDSIPKSMEAYKEELKEHLGKPLCDVPDPTHKSKSFGEHYLEEAVEIMEKMDVHPKLMKSNELYSKGIFDRYAILFLDNLDKVKEIIERTSGRTLKKDWSPIMPICEKCGKIATTRVVSVKKIGDDYEYEYVCDKDVSYTKGCGYRGKARISDHKYKLQWRLHWPSWQHYFKTTAEGGGVDHFTRGGSWDTAKAIHKEIFHEDPPIGFKYGFVLMGGKKFSKSKGIGMSVKEMLQLVPAEVIKYHLLKYDLNENIDFMPTKDNILSLINDYEAASIAFEKKDKTKAEIKKAIAYEIAGKRTWKSNFRDVLLLYQIYRDWEKVSSFIPIEDIEILKHYIENWIKMDFVPDDYNFTYKPVKAEGIVKSFFEKLKDDMNAKDIHNFVYEYARENGIEPREMFKSIYKTLIGKERGPRLGNFLYTIGVKKVKKDVLGD